MGQVNQKEVPSSQSGALRWLVNYITLLAIVPWAAIPLTLMLNRDSLISFYSDFGMVLPGFTLRIFDYSIHLMVFSSIMILLIVAFRFWLALIQAGFVVITLFVLGIAGWIAVYLGLVNPRYYLLEGIMA